MYTCNPSASERQAASATRQVPGLSGLRDTVSKAKTESREMDSALPPCTEAKSTILCPSDLHRQAFLGSQSTSQSKHSGSSVTCYNTCSQTGVLLLRQVSLGSARGRSCLVPRWQDRSIQAVVCPPQLPIQPAD